MRYGVWSGHETTAFDLYGNLPLLMGEVYKRVWLGDL